MPMSPKEFGVNPTFNVSDLVPYRGPTVELSEELQPLSSLKRELTLHHQSRGTGAGKYTEYWMNKPLSPGIGYISVTL